MNGIWIHYLNAISVSIVCLSKVITETGGFAQRCGRMCRTEHVLALCGVRKGSEHMRFNVQKGDVLWTLWADMFLLWREHGNVKTNADADEWYKAARELDNKYSKTQESDLARKIIISMGEIIDERVIKSRER